MDTIKVKSKVFIASQLFLWGFLIMFGYEPMTLKASQAEGISTGKIHPEVLNHFYPLVLKELQSNLSLQSDKRTRRKTNEYGYSFFKMTQGDLTYTPPPAFLIDLGNKVCKALDLPPQNFSNFIVSLYEPGLHLEPHVDIDLSQSEYGFYFSEQVFGIIMEPDSTGHLQFIYYDGKDAPPPLNLKPLLVLEEEAGTVYLLQGKYRHAPYFHGVSKVSNHRISVTFRTVNCIKN